MRRGVRRNLKLYQKTLPTKADFVLALRGPWEPGRASVTLLIGEKNAKGKREYKPYYCSDVLALDRQFKAGSITASAAKEALEAIRLSEYERIAKQKLENLAANNTDLVEKYIQKVVNRKVDILAGSRASQADGAWALVRLLQKTDLTKASHQELQRILNTLTVEGSFKKSFAICRSMLRFIGRYEVAAALKPKRFKEKKPAYLTREQVYAVIDAIPLSVLETHPLMPELVRIIFNLGLRFSEALGLDKSDVQKKNGAVVIHVRRQYAPLVKGETEADRYRPTKGKRERYVVPLAKKECLKDLAKWVSTYPTPQERDFYRYTTSKLIHELCVKLFKTQMDDLDGDDESFFFDEGSLPDADDVREYKGSHMLRASHAVYLMEQLGNESFTANQIGDTVEVVRKHYSGRFNTDRTLSSMSELLEKNLPKG